jgi:hypothetical protein
MAKALSCEYMLPVVQTVYGRLWPLDTGCTGNSPVAIPDLAPARLLANSGTGWASVSEHTSRVIPRRSAMWATLFSPHSQSGSSAALSDSPNGVIEYSTFGGTSLYCRR